MNLKELVTCLLNENFQVLEPNSAILSKMTVEVSQKNASPTVLSLAELFTSEILRSIFCKHSNEDYIKCFNRNPKNQNDLNKISLAANQVQKSKPGATQLELRCKLADLYLEALETVPYELAITPDDFLLKVEECIKEKCKDYVIDKPEEYRIFKTKEYITKISEDFLNGKCKKHLKSNDGDLLSEIRSDIIPKLELSPEFNLELIKLIFQMRHHLFFETDVILSPELLIDLFDHYEALIFDPNLTADIFFKYRVNGHVHIKMKCSMVFGLNLYYMLHKKDLLDSFKDVLFSKDKQVAHETKMFNLNIFEFFRLSAEQRARLKALRKNIKRAFFGKDSQVLSVDKFKDLLAQYKSVSFISPLFRIVMIYYDKKNKPRFIRLNNALTSMRYNYINEDQICLSNSPYTKLFSNVPFLSLFNEGNGMFRKAIKFEVFVTEEQTEGLDAMLSAMIHFIPSIKTLSVSTTSITKYNLVYEDNYTYFDMLIESLVSKNQDALKHLNGFEMHGFNRLSLRTLLHLKQYKLEKLGVRGLFSCVDELYLYILLREETSKTLKKLHKIYGTKNTIKKSEFTKYNNLRNSVTHLTCTEDVLRNTMKYCIAENIQSASVHLHNYNSDYAIYPVEESILKEIQTLKEKSKNLKETPMPLQKLEFFIEKDYMERLRIESTNISPSIKESILLMRMQNNHKRNFYNEILKNETCIYRVSELVVKNSLDHSRPDEIMLALSHLANFSTSYEVTVTSLEIKNLQNISNFFNGLTLDEKTLILRYSTNPFKDVNNQLLNGIYKIYQQIFRDNETAKLKIVFSTLELNNGDEGRISRLAFDYIIMKQASNNQVPSSVATLNKKIQFEIEG
ncbi:hypothetical protein ENBRE01_1277 [Enteropsectra breve]|nr:hypothetical protein ENBRE01_1277 [Enteropsectra breve]